MTAKGEDGFAFGLVADCATEAAACSGVGHIDLRLGRGIGRPVRRERNGPDALCRPTPDRKPTGSSEPQALCGAGVLHVGYEYLCTGV
jgi:hypothetical protein